VSRSSHTGPDAAWSSAPESVSKLTELAIREPGVGTPEHYRKRVRWLAIVYAVLLLECIAGEVILLARARYFVILTQRTNVETLTLAFFGVFFLYVGAIGVRALPGVLRVARFALMRRPYVEVERAKTRALGAPRGEPPVCAMSHVVEREGHRARSVHLAVADDAGSLGVVEIDGARITHHPECGEGSSNLLGFTVYQMAKILRRRGLAEPQIIEWKKVDDEETEAFLAHVEFARRLADRLGGDPLWPTVELSEDDCHELEEKLALVAPAVREESFLPRWEYRGEHKLPIIPEPLGLISLGRAERRVDPLASMTAIAAIVLVVLALMIFLVARPPWMPGS